MALISDVFTLARAKALHEDVAHCEVESVLTESSSPTDSASHRISEVFTPVRAKTVHETRAPHEIDSGHEDNDQPSSPVDSALLRIRRARAFLGGEKASMLAERLSADLKAAKLAAVQDTTIVLPGTSWGNGCTQEELDAFCVDESCVEKGDQHDQAPTCNTHAQAAGGLEQAALDELCIENLSDAEEEEAKLSKSQHRPGSLAAASLQAVNVKTHDDEKEADEIEGDALLLRVRRLRAFRSQAEAKAFAESVDAKVERPAGLQPKPRPSRLHVQGLSSLSTLPRKESSMHDSPVLKVASPLRKRHAW